MPFGLCNAPASFQAWMNFILRDLLDGGVVVYMDDILIFSRTRDEHERMLRHVFKLLSDAGVRLAPHKCLFWQSEVKFLGWIVGHNVIQCDPVRIKNILNWPKPTTTTELRGFIGLVNQLLPAVPSLARVTGPLTSLLQGAPRKLASVVWTQEAGYAFLATKELCSEPKALRAFDPDLPTSLYTDWSSHGIGAWVGQTITPGEPPVPIAFYSRKLEPSERADAAYQGELLALASAVSHFRPYLVGREVHVFFDQRSLASLLRKPKLTAYQ